MTNAHPDDERLSAFLDGDDDAVAVAEHVASCPDCQARVDAFRRVIAAVGTPVAPAPAGAEDAAVAAARAAGAGTGDDVVPMRPRQRPQTPFLLGAAALVLVVLVAASLLGRDNGGRDTDAALSSEESGQVTAGGTAYSGASDGGDLGDQADAKALADRLRGVLEPPAADAATEGADSGGATAGGATASGAPMAATAKRSADSSSTDGPDCTATVAREYGSGLGPLAYRATLRWEGTPAVVLVYPVSGATGGLDRRVLVMARSDCRLLVAQTI